MVTLYFDLHSLARQNTKGAFVWDQSGIRIIGIMRVTVCLGAILIPEYLDFHYGYSTPRSRIAGIYSGIYSGISQTNTPLNCSFKRNQVYQTKTRMKQLLNST